jgi:hypothetical protein
MTWFAAEDSTYQGALDLCAPVPPVIREGEASSTATKALTNKERHSTRLLGIIANDDWVNRRITSLHPRFQMHYPKPERIAVVPFITADRFKLQPPEIDERVTDDFHLSFFLKPAAAIAGSILQEEPTAMFSPRTSTGNGSTIGDVQIKNKEGKCYLTAEDNRGHVSQAHALLLRRHINSAVFPWPGERENPRESVRIWMQAGPFCARRDNLLNPLQLWTQILEYNTLCGKLFTILGTIYIYGKPEEYNLYCSKTYDDLENDVLRTTAVVITSKETSHQLVSIAARLIASIEKRPILWSFGLWLAEKDSSSCPMILFPLSF